MYDNPMNITLSTGRTIRVSTHEIINGVIHPGGTPLTIKEWQEVAGHITTNTTHRQTGN